MRKQSSHDIETYCVYVCCLQCVWTSLMTHWMCSVHSCRVIVDLMPALCMVLLSLWRAGPQQWQAPSTHQYYRMWAAAWLSLAPSRPLPPLFLQSPPFPSLAFSLSTLLVGMIMSHSWHCNFKDYHWGDWMEWSVLGTNLVCNCEPVAPPHFLPLPSIFSLSLPPLPPLHFPHRLYTSMWHSSSVMDSGRCWWISHCSRVRGVRWQIPWAWDRWQSSEPCAGSSPTDDTETSPRAHVEDYWACECN